MRTIPVYTIDELEPEAQKAALNKLRDRVSNDLTYNEAYETVKEFNNLFGTRIGSRSWLEFRMPDTDNYNIEHIKGWRLHKYIWNNFGGDLFKGKYRSVQSEDIDLHHNRVTTKVLGNGRVHHAYRSAIFLENSCVFTGVCWDDSMLEPIYKFLAGEVKPDQTFEDLISDCFHVLGKALEAEDEYQQSDECLLEEAQVNGLEFLENGMLV
jgi:hypothetical protein